MNVSKQKIYVFMAEKCINISELANLTNLSINTIYSVINHKRQPKPSTVGKIAKALNVDVEKILEY